MPVPPSLGSAQAFNFQPTGAARLRSPGCFATTASRSPLATQRLTKFDEGVSSNKTYSPQEPALRAWAGGTILFANPSRTRDRGPLWNLIARVTDSAAAAKPWRRGSSDQAARIRARRSHVPWSGVKALWIASSSKVLS